MWLNLGQDVSIAQTLVCIVTIHHWWSEKKKQKKKTLVLRLLQKREKSTKTSTDNSCIDQHDRYVIIMSYRARLAMNIDPDVKMLLFRPRSANESYTNDHEQCANATVRKQELCGWIKIMIIRRHELQFISPKINTRNANGLDINNIYTAEYSRRVSQAPWRVFYFTACRPHHYYWKLCRTTGPWFVHLLQHEQQSNV